MLTLLLACTDGSTTGGDSGGSASAASMSTVWAPTNAAWDLAVDGERLLCTAQFGGSLLGWTPDGGEEELGRDLGQPLGVLVHEGTVYLSGTDNSIAGWVGVFEGGRDVTVLAEAGDAGLPMRRPADLAWYEGALAVADPVAEVVWSVEADGSSATVLESGVAALSLAVHDGALVVGTEDAVQVGGELLEEREAFGLNSETGALLASGLDGVREVNGALLGEGPGRPGSLELYGDGIYVADQAEGHVWLLEEW